MKSPLLRILAILGLLVVAIAIGFLSAKSGRIPPPTELAAAPSPSPKAALPSHIGDPTHAAAPSHSEPQSGLAGLIDHVLGLLQRREAKAGDLAALRHALLAAPPDEAIAVIRGFLATGIDAQTGQDFDLAPGGLLAGSPTLRLLLLDVLGQVARGIRSAAAAETSREILDAKTSADEWALALRNVAWAEPRSREFLVAKMRELLAHEPWRAAPSDGMLEALDVLVFAKDPSTIADLANLRDASRELAHAADIALDRLADGAPLDVLTYLNMHPAMLANRPLLRADYYAKADLSKPAQRAQVEHYLSRGDVTLPEKNKLLRALATPASFVSNSLLSQPPPPDDGSARRSALLKTTGEWLTTQRFPDLRPTLLELQQRMSR